MKNLTAVCVLLLSLQFLVAPTLSADDTSPATVKEVINAVGGEDKLLNLFRFQERVLITTTPAAPVKADEKPNRTSVVQVGGDWWLGNNKRDKDKVRVLCWAWSLRILRDDKSKIAELPVIEITGKPAFGLRVTESIKEPIDLYFDQETKRLVAIDYTDTRHVFSEWKETSAGHKYPSHVTGYRFADRKTGKVKETQWYQTDILDLTPLTELPEGLKK